MANPVSRYDFTLKECNREIIQKWLEEYCKKWCYQLEEGETGYRHYQGRISLKVKTRLLTLATKTAHIGMRWSITHVEEGDDFYACKEETRIDGPWKDTDEKIVIPRQYMIEKLLPWQQTIYDRRNEWDTRSINVVLDETGNIGKSTLVGYMCCRKESQMIPYCTDIRDMMRIIMDTPKRRIYLIDFPKALGKDKLAQFMSGLETLKNGYCYDDRYTFKECWFDSPNIWIFTNKVPPIETLSSDRWKLWKIHNQRLINQAELDFIAQRDIEKIIGAPL